MTTTTAQPLTFGRLVKGEWIKFRSLRANWWILILGTLFMPLFAVSRMVSIAQVPEAVGSDSLVGAAYVTSGVALTQLAFALLAVMSITGEYNSGQIRTTFAVAPARLKALAAKLAVVVAVVVVASIIGVALSWGFSSPWFSQTGMSITLLDPDDARLILGVPPYIAAIAALAFAIGLIVRSSALGISIVLGLLLVVENLLASIPWTPLQTFASYLPSSAGSRLLQSDAVGSVITVSNTALLSPWQGYGVLLLWVIALLTVAAVLLRRKDA
jgi:ABC-2 type transport system permease protein